MIARYVAILFCAAFLADVARAEPPTASPEDLTPPENAPATSPEPAAGKAPAAAASAGSDAAPGSRTVVSLGPIESVTTHEVVTGPGPDLTMCAYQPDPGPNPLPGQLVLQVTVRKHRLDLVTVEAADPTTSGWLNECMTKALASWRWPLAKGIYRVPVEVVPAPPMPPATPPPYPAGIGPAEPVTRQAPAASSPSI